MMTSDSRKRAAEAEREAQSPPAPVDVGDVKRLLAELWSSGRELPHPVGVLLNQIPALLDAAEERDRLRAAYDAVAIMRERQANRLDAALAREKALREGIEKALGRLNDLRHGRDPSHRIGNAADDLRALLSPEAQS